MSITSIDDLSSLDAVYLLEQCESLLDSLDRGDAVAVRFEFKRLGNETNFYLARRIRCALHDLGLRNVLPGAWVTPAADGLRFSALSLQEADQLVLALEDIAQGRRPRVTAIRSANQLRLF